MYQKSSMKFGFYIVNEWPTSACSSFNEIYIEICMLRLWAGAERIEWFPDLLQIYEHNKK